MEKERRGSYVTGKDNFQENYCILKENAKNNITGEAVEKGDFGSLGPPQALLFKSALFW